LARKRRLGPKQQLYLPSEKTFESHDQGEDDGAAEYTNPNIDKIDALE
jgi:hypothetical protein